MFLGPHGLRCGWAAVLFIALYKLFLPIASVVVVTLYPDIARDPFLPQSMLVGELIPFSAVFAAGLILARVMGLRLGNYNFSGRRRLQHSLMGLVTGFAALSCLIGALDLGGWVRFAPKVAGLKMAAELGLVWAAVFLLVGMTEEGAFRCFLLGTLNRGINLRWALAAQAGICAYAAFSAGSSGAVGVYLCALLGIAPCIWLERRKAAGAGFWQAAWVTSTLFGAIHTGNEGENWMGIFAAAAIGFVFCASVKLTGSVWWAVGCHASWDWAETFFYGTPDSGMIAKGHLLSAASSGPAIWSGGADGPEGSLLVIPTVLLILMALIVQYGRSQRNAIAGTLAEHSAS